MSFSSALDHPLIFHPGLLHETDENAAGPVDATPVGFLEGSAAVYSARITGMRESGASVMRGNRVAKPNVGHGPGQVSPGPGRFGGKNSER